MEHENDNSMKVDIPQDAIDEALRSVERTSSDPLEAAEVETDQAENAMGEDVRQLRALLDESTARAAETSDRLKDTHDRYLRVAADFENWKKRASRERDETIKFANERLLKDLLLVVDNLDRAVGAGGDPATLLSGVKLVLKQFIDTIGKFGVKSFSAVGEPFDPARHEALMQMESATVPANHVVNEMAKGYMLNDRLVRPAQVVVSKGPPAGQPSAEPPPDPTPH